jgi:hypothetical protein
MNNRKGMKRLGDRALLMMRYIRQCPGCRPRDIAVWSGVYGSWDITDARLRRTLFLAVGSMSGLLAKAGLVRREENPRRLWITTKGLSAVAGASATARRRNEAKAHERY